MSRLASNHKINLLSCSHNFSSSQSLSNWLKTHLPSNSFASWGVKPGTKNVHNFWLKLSKGKTFLPIPLLQFARFRLSQFKSLARMGKILIESHQELSDDNVRKWGRSLSKKMKPSEDLKSTTIRVIKEELGSMVFGLEANLDAYEIVTIDPNLYEIKVEEHNSDSYLGLPGCYILHTLNATIEGLPEGIFVHLRLISMEILRKKCY